MAVEGTWGIGDYKIPDWGLTEGTSWSYMAPDTFVNPNVTQSTTNQTLPTSYPGTQGFIGPSLNPSNTFVNNSTGTQPTGTVLGSTPPPSGTTTKTDTSPNNYWDDAKNEGMLNGNLFRDKNQWLSAGGQIGGGGGPSQDEINRQIDEIFGGNEGYFGQVESNLRKDFPTVQSEINAQFGLGEQQLGSAKKSALDTVGLAETATGQRKQETDAAGRKLYNELMMGGRQRYGGASSAGQAFSELNAVEQQRRAGENAKLYMNTMKELEVKKSEIEREAQNSLAKHVLERDMALTQAQRDFDNKMMEVSRMRAANNQSKAEARLSALMDLRNQMYQIQLENQQFENTVKLQKEARLAEFARAQSVLDQYASDSGVASGNFANLTNTNPTSAYTPGNTTQSGQGAMPTGRVSREEDLVGSLFNTPRREELDGANRLFSNLFGR